MKKTTYGAMLMWLLVSCTPAGSGQRTTNNGNSNSDGVAVKPADDLPDDPRKTTPDTNPSPDSSQKDTPRTQPAGVVLETACNRKAKQTICSVVGAGICYDVIDHYAEINVPEISATDTPIIGAWLCGLQLSENCKASSVCTRQGDPPFWSTEGCRTTAVRLIGTTLRVNCGWEYDYSNDENDSHRYGTTVRVRIL